MAKLFTKYNRSNMAVMVVLFLLSGICYYFLINYVLVHELDEALEDYQARIHLYVGQQGKLPPVTGIDETRVSYILAGISNKAQSISTVVISDRAEKRSHNYRQLSYVQKVGNASYRVTIAKPIEGVRLLTRTVVGITIAMLLIVLLTTIVFNQIILRRLWQPFYHSLAAIKTFKLGKKQIPHFHPTDIDEFTYMNQLLEDTITNAETDYQVLKEFTENASHEIQTPLAIIRAKLDLVIQEEGLSEKQTQALGSIYSGIKRLNKLNQSLLLLAKIENNQYGEAIPVNLLDSTQEKIDQFQEFWLNNQITCHADLHPATINANPELIDILLNNLISNAARHNKAGGAIRIKLNASELYIENTGPFRQLDTSRLFRRFYKEQQHSQHNGLGLSIVKQICDQLSINIGYTFSGDLHRFTLNWN
jgi:signal transduction histidine kinase